MLDGPLDLEQERNSVLSGEPFIEDLGVWTGETQLEDLESESLLVNLEDSTEIGSELEDGEEDSKLDWVISEDQELIIEEFISTESEIQEELSDWSREEVI